MGSLLRDLGTLIIYLRKGKGRRVQEREMPFFTQLRGSAFPGQREWGHSIPHIGGGGAAGAAVAREEGIGR